jgi:hypothetical protein
MDTPKEWLEIAKNKSWFYKNYSLIGKTTYREYKINRFTLINTRTSTSFIYFEDIITETILQCSVQNISYCDWVASQLITNAKIGDSEEICLAKIITQIQDVYKNREEILESPEFKNIKYRIISKWAFQTEKRKHYKKNSEDILLEFNGKKIWELK